MVSNVISICGTVGVPGQYGGFETLAENLVRYAKERGLEASLTVYCSSRTQDKTLKQFEGARLRYVPLSANGAQSIPYDFVNLAGSVLSRSKVILLLGVSGALLLPLVRLVSRARVVTNIDGIEWRREKWGRAASTFLKFSERIAVRYSHDVIADNAAIAEYVRAEYGADCHVIAYGGDHALSVDPTDVSDLDLPDRYGFCVSRIEPENNTEMVLRAMSRSPGIHFVYVGNWNSSAFGRDLRARFTDFDNLHLLDPIYDAARLRALREGAAFYAHGHSAGGTNPSLVEIMQFAIPVLAFDCSFNRATTENRALFFGNAEDLTQKVAALDDETAEGIGTAMKEIADRRYTWDAIGKAYFDLMIDTNQPGEQQS